MAIQLLLINVGKVFGSWPFTDVKAISNFIDGGLSKNITSLIKVHSIETIMEIKSNKKNHNNNKKSLNRD